MSGEAQKKLDGFIVSKFTDIDKFEMFADLIIDAAVERVGLVAAQPVVYPAGTLTAEITFPKIAPQGSPALDDPPIMSQADKDELNAMFAEMIRKPNVSPDATYGVKPKPFLKPVLDNIRLQWTIDGLKSHNEYLGRLTDKLQAERDSARKEWEQLRDELVKTQGERDSLIRQREILRAELDNARRYPDIVSAKGVGWSGKDVENLIDAQNRNLSECHRVNSEKLAEHQAENARLYGELEKADRQIVEARGGRDRMHRERNESDAENKSLRAERDAFKAEADRLLLEVIGKTTERDTLANLLSDAKARTHTQSAGYMEEIDNLMREVNKLKDERETLVSASKTREALIETLNDQVINTMPRWREAEKLRAENVQLRADNAALDNKLAVLRADRDALESVKEDFKAANKRFVQELISHGKAIVEQRETIGRLKAENTKLGNELGRWHYDYPGVFPKCKVAPQGEAIGTIFLDDNGRAKLWNCPQGCPVAYPAPQGEANKLGEAKDFSPFNIF